MVALLELSHYSPDELKVARQSSAAFQRYEMLCQKNESDPLHLLRHRGWLECVMATYTGRATTAEICAHWSAVADQVIQTAWSMCGLDQLPVALFALGKHGAQELNLSSDIDVLIVAEPQRLLEVEKGLRKFQSLVQKPGDFGFCFRLDFDLRPGGTMGPMITTPSQFQDYYWSQGETWERLALVRLRPLIGPATLIDPVVDLARRFSFRKFLDFTLLDDLKALRSQVHQKGFARKDGELNLKLEVGGIRDIELFTHSLLVLHGGKVTELQTRSTTDALQKLKRLKVLSIEDSEFLLESYWHFRHLENLVQAENDQQTHSLKLAQPPPFYTEKEADLRARMTRVKEIVAALLGAVDLEKVRLPTEPNAQQDWLRALGFNESSVTATWPQLMSATALSHKNDRDERARQEFLYSFVEELARQTGPDRDLGLSILVDFVRSTRAKATFFTTLLRSPRLMQDLARLFCLSPYLGSILASRPELLDGFILKVDDSWSEEMDTLLSQMSERKLLTEIWAANHFLSDESLVGLYERETASADSICQQLLKQLLKEFPSSKVDLITLGKWGGRELGLRSDLDFIFVTPEAPKEDDFKVARRFIARLTDPLKGGSLYDVDLRLRPSGQSGALLVSLSSLHEYWGGRAEAWERQAYLRARPLDPINVKIDKKLLLSRPLKLEELESLKNIRLKLLKLPTEQTLDIKYAPGGLLDIEFVAQTAILKGAVNGADSSTTGMVQVLGHQSPEWKAEATKVIANYEQLRRFEQLLQLASAHKTSMLDSRQASFQKFSHLLKLDAESTFEKVRGTLKKSRQLLDQLDPTGLKF